MKLIINDKILTLKSFKLFAVVVVVVGSFFAFYSWHDSACACARVHEFCLGASFFYKLHFIMSCTILCFGSFLGIASDIAVGWLVSQFFFLFST